jgi:AcrR family transcriptional regulator
VTIEYSGTGDPTRSMELLWGLQERPKRGPKPKLSVEQISAAAIALADAEGLAAVSMRRVADELGVTAMSLYTYVPGKAELLDLMLDRVYAEAVAPSSAESAPAVGSALSAGPAPGWRVALASIARANWAMFVRHPWMLQVATSRPVLGPNLVAKYDHELRAVEGIGLSDIEMDLVISLVLQYTVGAVRAAVEAEQAERRTGMSEERWWSLYAPLLERVFDAERYPVAARVGAASGEEYQAAADPARAFAFGLERVLDGVAAFVAARP